MVVIMSKPLDIKKVVEAVRETGFPCFDTTLGRDEVAQHTSFFVYMEDGGLQASTHGNQYHRTFTLMFVSRDEASFDELALIDKLKGCRLVFDRSEVDRGGLLGTEEQVLARTMYFHQVIKVER